MIISGAPTTPEEILLNANVDYQTFTIWYLKYINDMSKERNHIIKPQVL